MVQKSANLLFLLRLGSRDLVQLPSSMRISVKTVVGLSPLTTSRYALNQCIPMTTSCNVLWQILRWWRASDSHQQSGSRQPIHRAANDRRTSEDTRAIEIMNSNETLTGRSSMEADTRMQRYAKIAGQGTRDKREGTHKTNDRQPRF